MGTRTTTGRPRRPSWSPAPVKGTGGAGALLRRERPWPRARVMSMPPGPAACRSRCRRRQHRRGGRCRAPGPHRLPPAISGRRRAPPRLCCVYVYMCVYEPASALHRSMASIMKRDRAIDWRCNKQADDESCHHTSVLTKVLPGPAAVAAGAACCCCRCCSRRLLSAGDPPPARPKNVVKVSTVVVLACAHLCCSTAIIKARGLQ